MSVLLWRPSKQPHITLGYIVGARGVAYCVAKLHDEWRNPLIPANVKTKHARYTVELRWPLPQGTDPVFKTHDAAAAKDWAARRVADLHTAITFALTHTKPTPKEQHHAANNATVPSRRTAQRNGLDSR